LPTGFVYFVRSFLPLNTSRRPEFSYLLDIVCSDNYGSAEAETDFYNVFLFPFLSTSMAGTLVLDLLEAERNFLLVSGGSLVIDFETLS